MRVNALLETIVDRIAGFFDVLHVEHVVLDELVSSFIQLDNSALKGKVKHRSINASLLCPLTS